MKLRLAGNSLRLRLNQGEVAQFSKTGYVEETVHFGPGASLAYVLESSTRIDAPRAHYRNGELRIQIPASAGQEWVTTGRVGVSGQQSLDGGEQLSILIEKDFQCLHDGEQDPDAYPNPLEARQ
jgi:hypothetical protein